MRDNCGIPVDIDKDWRSFGRMGGGNGFPVCHGVQISNHVGHETPGWLGSQPGGILPANHNPSKVRIISNLGCLRKASAHLPLQTPTTVDKRWDYWGCSLLSTKRCVFRSENGSVNVSQFRLWLLFIVNWTSTNQPGLASTREAEGSNIFTNSY